MVLRAAGPRKRLPRRAVTGLWPGGAGPGGGDGRRRLAGSCAVGALVRRRALGGAVGTVRRRGLRIGGLPLFVPELRSEERRVGREGRGGRAASPGERAATW